MLANLEGIEAPVDGRQSPMALAVARGVGRLMLARGFAVVHEVSLATGRRADIVALGPDGEIWIVEIKSSLEDFRADHKWEDYRFSCDRLFFATHAAVPHLLQQRSGHVVTVSSIAGVRASAGSAVYNATKFGVNAFSEALRQELAEHDVRVTTINPGAVETELRTHLSDEMQRAQAERFADVELLQADDIADAIVYAISQPPYVSINDVLVRPTRQQR